MTYGQREGYDQSVQTCEEENEYPFAGYKQVLGAVYRHIRMGQGRKVLDAGFGTGTLLKRLYDDGYDVFGFDFSEKMMEIARRKMPGARLVQHDLSNGLPEEWADERYDCIVCTYAIHHIPYSGQSALIRQWMQQLLPGGRLLIGDVAFENMQEMENCRARCGEYWDDEEHYPVWETVRADFPDAGFEKQSFCAGVFVLLKD